MKRFMAGKLKLLWEEGISGADFFISAIGSAIEVFGKYEQVMDYEGNIIRANKLLEDIRQIVTDFAVREILHNGFAGEISSITRFYVLYRWTFGVAMAPFDEANKLARGCGIDLAEEWGGKGFIKKLKDKVRVLEPHERKENELKGSGELIDVLHHSLLLWDKGKRDEMLAVLKSSGYGGKDAFYRVAQAISETLTIEDKEKKMLDGFLAGKDRVMRDIVSAKKKGGEFDFGDGK